MKSTIKEWKEYLDLQYEIINTLMLYEGADNFTDYDTNYLVEDKLKNTLACLPDNEYPDFDKWLLELADTIRWNQPQAAVDFLLILKKVIQNHPGKIQMMLDRANENMMRNLENEEDYYV